MVSRRKEDGARVTQVIGNKRCKPLVTKKEVSHGRSWRAQGRELTLS